MTTVDVGAAAVLLSQASTITSGVDCLDFASSAAAPTVDKTVPATPMRSAAGGADDLLARIQSVTRSTGARKRRTSVNRTTQSANDPPIVQDPTASSVELRESEAPVVPLSAGPSDVGSVPSAVVPVAVLNDPRLESAGTHGDTIPEVLPVPKPVAATADSSILENDLSSRISSFMSRLGPLGLLPSVDPLLAAPADHSTEVSRTEHGSSPRQKASYADL